MTNNIEKAKDLLNKLNGVNDEEMTMKKIKSTKLKFVQNLGSVCNKLPGSEILPLTY